MTHEVFAQQIVAMQGTLYRVSSSILPQLCDREDAVQACIEKAWRKRADLRDDAKLQSWVVRILIHECYQILRRRKRETPMEAVPEMPAPTGANASLYRFFSSLPDKLRLPMVLYYLEGYSIAEIGGMLRLPQGTVKSRLARGREKMKKDRAFEEVEGL